MVPAVLKARARQHAVEIANMWYKYRQRTGATLQRQQYRELPCAPRRRRPLWILSAGRALGAVQLVFCPESCPVCTSRVQHPELSRQLQAHEMARAEHLQPLSASRRSDVLRRFHILPPCVRSFKSNVKRSL
ncbi:hypothetical protein NDU88_007933 [Pleurodeles waltl]|uniref:Uncharacterized protein n=1 Tax=Pleurodeles waltl TaxID=8319 RepID=A0AAV7N896_PLEWA|nr:hypothetical protein NDU88_007933 [Pleurodeles waltl]